MRGLECLISATLLLGACTFDPSGLAGGDGGAAGADASDADARIEADACTPGCAGDALQVCEPAPALEACALGCTPGALTCRTLVPSNGARVDLHLQSATAALAIAAGLGATLDTDDGRLVIGEIEHRAGGEGVVSGIGFYRLSDQVAVLGVDSMSVGFGATLRLRGARALIILSAGDVAIEGVVDLSAGCEAGSVTCGGPGGGDGSADDRVAASGCSPGGNGDGAFGLKPETGGGGGSFGTAGAPGGAGDGSNPGGVGGALPGTCTGPELEPLLGGSGGGAGGFDECGGDGGGGGGALQITSLATITIKGNAAAELMVGIRASGAGGRGGENSDGGGGGGSGGGILLEALRIELDRAVLAANGGAGGGGGNAPETNRGEDGPFGNAQAQGGSGGRGGGVGASVLGAASAGVGGGDDTGGGGGGTGIVRLNVPISGLITGPEVIISPDPTRSDPGSR